MTHGHPPHHRPGRRLHIPGPEIRVRKGDVIQALLVNQLPVATTVHWHGVAIRNDMDGVPSMTQQPVPAGREFTYRFATECSR